MQISRLDINSIRNITSTRLDGLGRINIFYGLNGSGKTSLLEAVHLLCLGRTFRHHLFKSAIQDGQERATVFCSARAVLSEPSKMTVGVSRGRKAKPDVRINGESVSSLAELAVLFPVQLLDGSSFELLEGGPNLRRQFLDWGVFHVEHGFNYHWQAVKRCIKQRNLLLRRGSVRNEELIAWDRGLALHGDKVNAFRKAYLDSFTQEFLHVAKRLSGLDKLSLEFKQGWPDDLSLSEAITAAKPKDFQFGFTSVGPHRADLKIKIRDRPVSEVLSRGQEKALVCSLRLSQASVLKSTTGKDCIFLIDDLPAELDITRRKLLCAELEAISSQLFVTCIDLEDLGDVWSGTTQPHVFHVEHGVVRAAS